MRHSLTTILNTKLKKFHGGFFELDMLEIFTRAFSYQKSLLELKVVIIELTGLPDVVLSPQVLDKRLGILTSVLIEMNYFF